MSVIVLYDACVLYPASIRDLLMRLAVGGLCHARWSEEILDEVFRNLANDRPDLDPAKLARTRQRMCAAIPESLVSGYEDLVDSLDLPDPSDRHVLAAAIHSGAKVIVTENVRDFPVQALSVHGIVAQSTDKFVTRLIESAPEQVAEIVEKQAADLKKPSYTVDQLLVKLASNGLKRSISRLHEIRGRSFAPETSGDPS